jgi:phosphoribosylformimino-5-aminoimidazole carboxamide ribotide isomerase
MRVIPVLDLMGGRVVQGVQGHRARYQPVQSVLTASCAPRAVAQALCAETGCDRAGGALYIADLDAIEGRGDHRTVIQELSAEILACTGGHLWVDAGVRAVEVVASWIAGGVGRVVVGSETLDSIESLDAIRAAFPAERLVFSLDMQRGKVLSHCHKLRAQTPHSLLRRLADSGWTHIILLTLDRVGTGGGPDWSLLEAARQTLPDLNLIVGGGVRGIEDLHRLSHLGASGVLVASALHGGWLTRKELHALTTESGDQESSPDPRPRSGTQRG